MKRLTLLALLPFAAAATNTRDDYVQQWPLALQDAPAGAYRVALDEAVYRGAHTAGLGDLEVFNAEGQPLPTAVFPAERAAAAARTRRPLPWFPLPTSSAVAGGDLQLIARRDADGSVREIETTVAGKVAARAGGWLVDASSLRTTAHALLLDWAAQTTPLQVELRVESSDDLRNWSLLHAGVPLVDLSHDGRRLQQRRITLESHARYLRLVPVSAQALPLLSGISVEIDDVTAPLQWQWLQGEGKPADGGYLYELPGRFPVQLADIAGADNSALEWTLFSRETADARWQRRAGPWVAFRVGNADERGQSPAQVLGATLRDRYWKLVPSQPTASAPLLRWGYRAESLVFLAQGSAPFALAVGSARVTRAQAPLSTTLAALREQRGPQWQPAVATLQTPVQPLAGSAALQPVRDWKSFLLWSLLAVGALLVAGLALSLLRKPPPAA